MVRRVITMQDLRRGRPEAAEEPKVDDYKTRLMKYIPAEIVAAFVTIDGILRSVTQVSNIVYWVVFFVLLALTPVYIWRVTHDPNKKEAKAQIVVSSIAFFVWVFALGGPFSYLQWYVPVYGAVLLIIYTAIIPVFVGGKKP